MHSVLIPNLLGFASGKNTSDERNHLAPPEVCVYNPRLACRQAGMVEGCKPECDWYTSTSLMPFTLEETKVAPSKVVLTAFVKN